MQKKKLALAGLVLLNAPKKIRTFTQLPEQRPERCASANSAIGAKLFSTHD